MLGYFYSDSACINWPLMEGWTDTVMATGYWHYIGYRAQTCDVHMTEVC